MWILEYRRRKTFLLSYRTNCIKEDFKRMRALKAKVWFFPPPARRGKKDARNGNVDNPNSRSSLGTRGMVILSSFFFPSRFLAGKVVRIFLFSFFTLRSFTLCKRRRSTVGGRLGLNLARTDIKGKKKDRIQRREVWWGKTNPTTRTELLLVQSDVLALRELFIKRCREFLHALD